MEKTDERLEMSGIDKLLRCMEWTQILVCHHGGAIWTPIESRCGFRRAGDQRESTGALRLIGSSPGHAREGVADIGLDKIKKWFPSSREPAALIRAAFKLFESYI